MVIQTFERAYTVVSLYETGRLGNIYICRDSEKGGDYSVLCVNDASAVPDIVSALTLKVNKTVFTDYVEHFFWNGQLCIVMKHSLAVSLERKLEEETLSLAERMEIGRRILETIVLQDPPVYFLRACLLPQTVTVDPSLDVRFNYYLRDITEIDDCNASEIFGRIVGLFTLLFADELSKETPEPLCLYMKELRVSETLDFLKLYSDYCVMVQKVSALSPDEMSEPKSFLFRLWQKIKKFFKFFRKILLVLLILLAVAYLIYTIDISGKTGDTGETFDRIGTVNIE